MARLVGAVLLLTAACGGQAAVVASPSASPIAAYTSEPSPSPSPAPTASETPPPPTPAPTPPPLIRALRDLGPGETLRLLSEFHIPRSGFAVAMAFSPVQPVLYHTGVGLEIQGYDFEAGRVALQIKGFQQGAPLVLAVAAAGDQIVAEDGPTLGIWDLATAERIGSLQMPSIFAPFNGGFVGEGLFYADDESGNLAVWDAASWEELARLTYRGRSDGSFVLPDDQMVAMLIRGSREIRIVDWSGLPVRAVPLAAEPWRLLGVSPAGEMAALHVDVDLGTEGILITDLGEAGTAVRIPLLNVRATAISPDWRTLAVVDGDEVLRLIDTATGAQLYSQRLDALQVRGLAFSQDGSLLSVYELRENEAGGFIQIWGRGLP
jgi:WD40 repeat protein